jgi:serine/threonine protein kinase
VLIDDDWHAQLADFGLSNFSYVTRSLKTSQRGSLRWMAPELHYPGGFGLEDFGRTKASDIYALACLYFEVLLQCLARP